ncbi:MAG TPA: nodulation protein NfeD, partial [Vulgatibacter sp.]
MARRPLRLFSALALATALLAPGLVHADEATPGVPAVREVASCTLAGTVDGGSAAYLADCVRRAEAGGF